MSFSSGLLFFIALITRFFGLTWGGGFPFHPDENNMVNAIVQMTPINLNPHFFAYGQFPLYLGYITQLILGLPHNAIAITYVLRFWSAIFSTLSVYLFYLINRQLFPKINPFIATLLFIFTPGLIQIAHFGTTESLLVLIFLSTIYLSLKLYGQPFQYKYYFWLALICGIGVSSKLSSIVFIFPILLVSLISFFKHNKKLHVVFFTFYFLLFTLVFFILFSPFNILSRADFLSALKYETEVATGTLSVFYTTQFKNTLPYIYQITHIFPYVIGLPLSLFSLFGLCMSFRKYHQSLFIVYASVIFYFLYFGQTYVKWTRFMSPIFFIFPLIAAIFINQIHSKNYRYFVLIAAILPGIFFLKLYLYPDIRITASKWIIENLPDKTTILSEGGNVVNIPVLENNFEIDNYDFYQYHVDTLSKSIAKSDYIIIPSRRVFKNYNYTYYQHLFDGTLGFSKIKEFVPDKYLFFNPENAEETWTVFDRPTIRIYQKTTQLSLEEYSSLLEN
ncbi:MAG: glycosyltransferase family 39 protein [Microgenomates group bacterium]